VETRDYLKRFDILGLTETWVDGKRWKKIKNKLASDFEWECAPAKREHGKGRVKGGIIIAVRKSLKVLKIKEVTR